MAYARFGDDSNIYLYGCGTDGKPAIECCSCHLSQGESILLDGYDAAIAHVREHIKAGHIVPSDTIEYLEFDRDEVK